jgi:hypothetical protein
MYAFLTERAFAGSVDVLPKRRILFHWRVISGFQFQHTPQLTKGFAWDVL